MITELNLNEDIVEPVDAFILPDEALLRSLDLYGQLNPKYLESATGLAMNDIVHALKGTIFQNPETCGSRFEGGYELRSEYISGNLARKLAIAKFASLKYPGRFLENIKALEEAMPLQIKSNDIFITLGSPWIPDNVIALFLKYLSNERWYNSTLIHDSYTGSWKITNKNYWWNKHLSVEYGTKRINGLEIAEHLLNKSEIAIYDSYEDEKGKKKKRLNESETLLANEKASKIKELFVQWVWSNPSRKKQLTDIYNQNYGCYLPRQFNGDFLSFRDKSEAITLRGYQKDAVARMILSPNTLLAHDVGSGKTFEMIAAGEEMLRLHLSKKNLYVVPNGLISEWANSFKSLYPKANTLVVEPKMFNKQNKDQTLESIKNGGYTSVIMPYSCFDSISMSKEFLLAKIDDEALKINRALAGVVQPTSSITARFKAVKKKKEKLLAEFVESAYYFDDLGFDRLFVDEAHNYKNLISTSDNSASFTANGSKKCLDMFDKVSYIQKHHKGGGVVFATATPITNSISELFAMQRYLQRAEIEMLGMASFNAWIANFAEEERVYEISVDTSSFHSRTRYSKFHNLNELSNILADIIDFHEVPLIGLPNYNGPIDVSIEKSKELSEYLAKISKRADKIKKGAVKPKDDNFLKLTSDGRKAALDIRLVEPKKEKLGSLPNYKISQCADKVFEVYKKGEKQKLTQLVFSDVSTPSDRWNVYTELKYLLILRGVSEKEIAFIHDYDSPTQREKLFKMVNRGDIRVLIGSTFKLGTGVNVQERLVAIHHLDVPWRPSDMVQREGRMLRLGNKNKEVFVYRYIALNSFDAYSWQLLERKQAFISALLSSTSIERDADDVDDAVLDYAEVKSLAIGDPKLKERFATQNEIYRLKALERKEMERANILHAQLESAQSSIDILSERIKKAELDKASYEAEHQELSTERRKEVSERLFQSYFDSKDPSLPFESYSGFRLYHPKDIVGEKKSLILENNASYQIEVGDSALGMLTRIENFLSKLDSYIVSLEESKKKNEEILNSGKDLVPVSYDSKIASLKRKLKKLDEALLQEDK